MLDSVLSVRFAPPALIVVGWILFGGTHVLLSSAFVRSRIVHRIGERRFTMFYTALSFITISMLALTAASVATKGPIGFGLRESPIIRAALGVIAFAGMALAFAAIASFSRSAVATLSRRRRNGFHTNAAVLEPSPVERLTRHPFFVGFAWLMGAHALLASTLAGTIYFGGFALLAVIGIRLQDRKFVVQFEGDYQRFLDSTSIVPRLSDSWSGVSGLRHPSVVWSIVVASVLLVLHPLWSVGYGVFFVALIDLGGVGAVVRQLRRD